MSKQFMRSSLPDKYGFLSLQNKILEIMIYVDKICKENNIEYCLMGGSALGARRHGGFIPWDDDLDIFMTPDHYEKLRCVLKEKGDKDKYYLQEWGLTNGMITLAKIRMNNTTYIEEDLKNWDMHHGIYVDIFILHICPNNRLLQLGQCAWAKYAIMRGLCNRGYTKRKGLVGLILKIMKAFPKKFGMKHALKQVYKYRNKQTNFYCNFLGKAVFNKGIYKREWVDNPQYIPFETIELKTPKGLKEFLTHRFGDYMKAPSRERIKWEQHAWKWDIDKDFREYVKNVVNFKDEINLI